MGPDLALRVDSWRRSNLVAFGAKQTSTEPGLRNWIYEYSAWLRPSQNTEPQIETGLPLGINGPAAGG